MKLLAFSAKKQGGKSTAAGYFNKHANETYDLYDLNFADRLKEIVLELFVPATWNWEVYDLDTNKDTILPLGKTVRQTLQWFGTDVCRKAYPDVWVNAYIKGLQIAQQVNLDFENDELFILTADVRFPNEVKCIQDLGGHVIRLLRSPYDDQHESETALNTMQAETEMYYGLLGWDEAEGYFTAKRREADFIFDAIVDNREMTIDEQNEAVWKLVNERGWI